MRNLKRALSLTLASVMLLGMMVVGTSAASYPDVDSADNVEAIEVVKAVGVMVGDENGNFNPGNEVTRNEMAVVMAKLLLGDAAENYVGSSPFTDVPDWADKYVAACYNNGIVAGIGNNQYGGTLPVTAEQAAAMMLRALGYEKLSDGAADWAQPVVAKANQVRLFSSVGSNPKETLDRNQVAQLTLNTLKATMVTTSSSGSITIGDIVINNDVKYEDRTADNGDSVASAITAASGTNDELIQLGEWLYDGKLKLDDDTDELGRPATTWSYKGDEIVTVANSASYTLKDAFNGKELNTAVGSKAITYAGWTVKVDGVDGTGSSLAETVKTAASGKNTADFDFVGNGTVTEIFVDSDDETVQICVINTYAAEVDRVYTADDVKDDEKPYVTVDGIDYETTGFEEDDVVIYTKGKDDNNSDVIVTMTLAESVEGEVTKVTANKDFTVNGETYKYSFKFTDAKVASGSVDKEVLFYVDASGYVVKIGEAKTSNDYAVVLSTGLTDNQYDSTKKTYYANLLLTDGTEMEVTVKDDADYADADALKAAYVGKIVAYSEDDGKYVLTKKADPAGKADLAIVNGKATFIGADSSTVRTNDDTVFLIKDGDDYNVYVGYKAVPDVNGKGGTTIAVYAEANKPAKVVYITGADIEDSGEDSVIFIRANTNAAVINESGKEYREFDAVVDGVATKVQVAESALGASAACEDLVKIANDGKVYAVKSLSYNSKDLVTKYTVYGASNGTNTGYLAATGTVKAEAGVVGFGDSTYGWSEDAVVAKYDADAKTKLAISSINAIQTDTNDTVVLILDKNTVIGAFITVMPGNPDPVVSTKATADSGTVTSVGASASLTIAGYTVTTASGDDSLAKELATFIEAWNTNMKDVTGWEATGLNADEDGVMFALTTAGEVDDSDSDWNDAKAALDGVSTFTNGTGTSLTYTKATAATASSGTVTEADNTSADAKLTIFGVEATIANGSGNKTDLADQLDAWLTAFGSDSLADNWEAEKNSGKDGIELTYKTVGALSGATLESVKTLTGFQNGTNASVDTASE